MSLTPLDDKSNISVDDTEVHEFDSQFPWGESDDEITDASLSRCLEDTIPYEDTILIHDAFKTQLLNFDVETQMMDINNETEVMNIGGEIRLSNCAGETQIMNIGGETQVCDDDLNKDLATQLFHGSDDEVVSSSDGEETDRTEVLSDIEGSTDTQSTHSIVDQKLGKDEIQSSAACFQVETGCMTETSRSADACNSDPVRRGLTHINTAALCTFGLAARSWDSKVSECSNLCKNELPEKLVTVPAALSNIELVDEENEIGEDYVVGKGQQDIRQGNEKHNASSDRERSWFHCKTSTRLNMEEVGVVEEPEVKSNDDETTELPQFHGVTELAGLSYVNSQEPRELSQANALEVVDRYLEVNAFHIDVETSHGKAARMKSNPLLLAKGTQNLAKEADIRSMIAESRMLDWHDSCEDEGGGDFFCKKKNVLVGANFLHKKSSSVDRMPQNQNMKEKTLRTKSRNKLKNIGSKLKGTVHADSSFPVQNPSEVVLLEEMGAKRILDNAMDGLRNSDFTSEHLEAAEGSPDIPDVFDVGINTQMAAEAIEALANGCQTVYQSFQNSKGLLEKQNENSVASKQDIQNRVYPSHFGVTMVSKLPESSPNSNEGLNSLVPNGIHSKNARKLTDMDFKIKKAKKRKLSAKDTLKENEKILVDKSELKIQHRLNEGIWKLKRHNDQRCITEKAEHLKETLHTFSSIAWRTRQSTQASTFNCVSDITRYSGRTKQKLGVDSAGRNKCNISDQGCDASEILKLKCKKSKLAILANGMKDDGLVSGDKNVCDLDNANDRTDSLSEVWYDMIGKSIPRRKRSKRSVRKPVLSGKDLNSGGEILVPRTEPVISSRKDDLLSLLSPKQSAVCPSEAISPGVVCKPSDMIIMTPVSCQTPRDAASPVCIGREYYKQSCKKVLRRSSLIKELNSLNPTEPRRTLTPRDSRKRREMSSVRVFFSCHLDDYVTKQQKKIVVRLGASLASSISEATHLITDKFVRTRNMLEAIACGKPVVTDLWLESCGQASCFIDEKNYILRDAKKEKEIRFSMPVTLARASQYPLLKGKLVLITPNTKPGVEIISSLVRAVHGQAIGKICRSILKDGKFPDDLLVLSCEDDYEVCLPLMEKGASVYSAELLLNGIVIQRLEYERHHIFVDHVKRTHSTVLVKRDG